MSGSKTAYLSQRLLDHVLGGEPYVPPSEIWFVISTAEFDPLATGTACAEVLAGDYDRLGASNDADTFTAATPDVAPSVKSNVADLVWASATSDWGTPGSVYVADAADGGNLLYGADLSSADDVGVGDVFKILAGTFVFSED